MASGRAEREAPRKKRREQDAEGPAFRGQEVFALILIGLGVFLTVSALSFRLGDPGAPLVEGIRANWGGAFGFYSGGFFVEVFGVACYPFFGFLVYWGVLLFLRREIPHPAIRAFGALVLMVVLAVLLSGPEPRGYGPRTPFGLGGGLGQMFAPRLHHSFGDLGVLVLLLVTGTIAFMVATDWPLHAIAADARAAVERISDRPARRPRGEPSRLGAFVRSAYMATAAKVRSLFEPARTDEDEILEEVALETGGVRGAPVRVRRRARPAPEPVASAPEPERAPEPEPEPASEPPPARAQKPPTASPAGRRVGRKQPKEAEAAQPVQGVLPILVAGALPAAPAARRARERGRYEYPPIDLLETVEGGAVADEEELRKAAEAIERRLKSHSVDAKVVCISAGPAVTVFELELAEGLRVASVTKYAPDLAAALKAFSVRVVAPIPGKHTVGVEVPNGTRSLVRLRELVALREPGKTKEVVPLFLGRDVAGKPLVEDLARMPHLLIAGATGSGKSVCINAILLSVLVTKSPDDVRMILIDPKMVELQNFKGIPHLLCPVVTSMKQVPRVLDWAVETMEQRYALLSAAGVRNLEDYNALGEEKLKKRLGDAFDPERTPPHMPAIVMIIDEFADLMTVAASEIEVSIQRLAQKSRAVGLHVILATQRPSRDVITGLIKANLPTRIAFQVSSRVDARVVLDTNGAEQLLGHGDMLYIPPGTNRLVRAQGTFVSDDEIHAIVSFLEQQSASQEFEQTLVQVPTGSRRGAKERDELYEDAVRTVLEEQRGSATLLQRKLAIGYTRASRLIEIMCEDGVVGEFVGSKSREVLVSLEEWEAQRAVAERSREGEDALLGLGGAAVAAAATLETGGEPERAASQHARAETDEAVPEEASEPEADDELGIALAETTSSGPSEVDVTEAEGAADEDVDRYDEEYFDADEEDAGGADEDEDEDEDGDEDGDEEYEEEAGAGGEEEEYEDAVEEEHEGGDGEEEPDDEHEEGDDTEEER